MSYASTHVCTSFLSVSFPAVQMKEVSPMKHSLAFTARPLLASAAALTAAATLSACTGLPFGGGNESESSTTVTATETASAESSTASSTASSSSSSSSASSSSSSSAADVEGRTISVYDVEVGNCIAEKTAATDDQLLADDEVTVVDCGAPHREEVYYVTDMTETEIPLDSDSAGWEDIGIDYCTDPFETYTGTDVLHSDYSYSFWHPSEGSWKQGDKEIVCLISHEEDHSGSVKS